MAALSAVRNTKHKARNQTRSYPVAAAVKIWQGAWVAIDANGRATPMATATTLHGAGRAEATADNTSGAAGAINVTVREGVFVWGNSSGGDAIAATDRGALVYGVDDQTAALTNGGGTRSVGGRVFDVDTDGVWVETYEHQTAQDVDAVAAGTSQRKPVEARGATTAALPASTYANGTSGVGATLTADANGALGAVDGVTYTAGQRILVKNQVTTTQNGVFQFTHVGDGSNPWAMRRVDDFDDSGSIKPGAVVTVAEGTVNADTAWFVSSDGTAGVIGVGTDNIVFSRESGIFLLGTAQSVTALHTFDQDTLKQNNAAGTFGHTFRSAATAARTITLPDSNITTIAVSATAPIALSGAGDISITSPLPVANGGTGISTVASAGMILRATGLDTWAASTATFPNTVTGAGNILRASGANVWAESTATFPDTATGAGRILRASGANAWAESTATFPDAPAAVGDILHATGAGAYGNLTAGADNTLLCGTGAGVVPAYEASPTVSGSFTASTSLLSPILDADAAVALSIGPANATAINLDQNAVMAANKIFQGVKGSDLASANDMAVPAANYQDVTGAVQINTMATTSIQAGTMVTLQFDGAPTVKHNTGGAGASFLLAGGVDLVASADDTLSVVFDGVFWREVARAVI